MVNIGRLWGLWITKSKLNPPDDINDNKSMPNIINGTTMADNEASELKENLSNIIVSPNTMVKIIGFEKPDK